MAAARVDGVRPQRALGLPESKRTLRECGAAEQANFGISAYGWSLWLRDCVHGVEDELCGALFALKLSSLLASSVLHTASHSARNASQVIETSIKGATGARISQRKVGGSAVKRESAGADIRAKRFNFERRGSTRPRARGPSRRRSRRTRRRPSRESYPLESYGEHTPATQMMHTTPIFTPDSLPV